MRLSQSQLLKGIQSPPQLLRALSEAQAAKDPDADIRRNPQPAWITASIRAHYDAGRKPGKLIADYDARTSRAESRDKNATAIANGRRMLERFLSWDHELEPPLRWRIYARESQVLGHPVTMYYDLVDNREGRLAIRQIVTQAGLTRIDFRRLYAIATLLHAEAVLNAEVARVEIWHLRLAAPIGWPRRVLLHRSTELGVAFERMIRAVEGSAA